MAARIETQRAAERRLLGDISHELRSPLARLQVALDLAESGANTATRAYLRRIEEEVEELGALIGQLLTLTRLENAGPLQNAQSVDLAQLVAHVCADADFEASASGRTVELRATHSARVNGDVALLRSAIENVVRNALVHAPTSRVEVSLQTDETEAIVRVRDWGQGRPKPNWNRCSIRFFAWPMRATGKAAGQDWDFRSRNVRWFRTAEARALLTHRAAVWKSKCGCRW